MPLAEIVFDFDRLKTVSKGYASLIIIGMRTSSLVKVDIF
jgi:translation elongation factor EF-4